MWMSEGAFGGVLRRREGEWKESGGVDVQDPIEFISRVSAQHDRELSSVAEVRLR
jgi:hypothetical protein